MHTCKTNWHSNIGLTLHSEHAIYYAFLMLHIGCLSTLLYDKLYIGVVCIVASVKIMNNFHNFLLCCLISVIPVVTDKHCCTGYIKLISTDSEDAVTSINCSSSGRSAMDNNCYSP